MSQYVWGRILRTLKGKLPKGHFIEIVYSNGGYYSAMWYLGLDFNRMLPRNCSRL